MDIDIDAPIKPAGPSEAVQQFTSLLPEGYSDKPWVQELTKTANPLQELFNQHENQISLIGRKAEGLKVPAADASEDERKAFHKALGVPENVEDYKYEQPEVPEPLKEFFKQDDDLLGAMRTAAQKAGITPEGFKEITKAFDGYYLNQLQTTIDAANQETARLETAFKQKYGDRSNAVLEQWGALAKQAPDWAVPVLESLPEVAKVALAAWSDNISSKYIKEDKIDLGVPTTGHGLTQTEYGNQFAETFAALRAAKPGSAEHLKAQSAYDALRAKGAEQVFRAK
jgi:hypothetical protein